MLDVPEHRAQEQAGQRRADELDEDVARHPPPREVAAQRERQRHGRVQVRAGDRAHEQDDRRHHQARRDDRRGQADLPLRVQKPAARGGQHQREGAQQLREQPPPFLARVIEVRTVPELKPEHVMRARERRSPARRVDLPGRRAAHSVRPRAASRCAGPSARLTGTLSVMPCFLPVKRTEQAANQQREPAPRLRLRDGNQGQPLASFHCRATSVPRPSPAPVLQVLIVVRGAPGRAGAKVPCRRAGPEVRSPQGPRRPAWPSLVARRTRQDVARCERVLLVHEIHARADAEDRLPALRVGRQERAPARPGHSSPATTCRSPITSSARCRCRAR